MKLPSTLPFLNPVSFVDRLLFTKHLAIMLKSGIPLAESLETLRDQTKSKIFQRVLEAVLADVQNGASLKQALAKHKDIFGELYLSLVSVGEQSGNLEVNLEYLATQQKKTYELRKKVRSVMIYPVLVLSIAIAMAIGISLFVLPKLITLFESLDITLPLTTRLLLAFAHLMSDHGVLIVVGFLLFLAFIIYLLQTPKVKPLWHKLQLRIPVFGAFMQDIQQAAFCRNVGIMIKSGLPITTALQSEEQATTQLVYKQYIGNIATAVAGGMPIEEELRRGKYPYISPIATKMIGVGERTGKIDDTLLYLGDFFDEEADDMAKNFSTLIEPVILLFIGLVVAFLAFSIISPIYELTGSIRR